VTGGNDGKIKLWVFKDNKFELKQELGKHADWVRDVAWSNNIGLLFDTIATCSEDQKVKIWRKDPKDEWTAKEISLGVPAWKVSWS
jgi:protein transport protein SEC13